MERGEEEIDVEVSATVEHFSSYNPYECGLKITDISVDSPEGFKLTEEEYDRAEERLYEKL